MKEYDVLIELKHNSKKFTAGESIALEDKEAEPLMKLKVVSEKTMKLSELEELTGTPNKTPEPECSGKTEDPPKTDAENNENTNSTEDGSPEPGNENGSAEETSGTENDKDKKGKAGKK